MKTGSRVVMFGVAFAVLAMPSIYLLRHDRKTSGVQCEWRPDFSAQFKIKIVSVGELYEGVLNGIFSAAPRQVSMRYEADLEIKSLDDSIRPNVFSAALIAISGMENQTQALLDELVKPFNFQMDSNCHFSEFGFAADDGRESREIKKGLLVTMEVVTKSGKSGEKQWEIEQTDASGTFMARYQQNAESGDISRKKLYYSKATSISSNVVLKVDIQKSEGIFTPHPDFWVSKLSLQEKTRIMTDAGQPFLRSEINVTLQIKDSKDWLTSRINPPNVVVAWEGLHVSQESNFENSSYTATGRSVAGTLGEAMENFSRGDFSHGQIDRKAVADLVSFLTAHPEAVPYLFLQLKTDQIPDDLHAFIFFAFEKTGTPEVQRALSAVLNDEEYSEMNRMRAMHALADVKTPIEESVQALIDASKNFSDSPTGDYSLPSTALLALGVLEKQQLNGSSSELAKLASEELVTRMSGKASPQERAVLAEALGNTGNPKHEQLILDQFDDENAMVRAASARGLSSLGSPYADQVLLDAVAKELNHETRKSIAEAWVLKQGAAGRFDVSRLAATISGEVDEGIRLALVSVLGREAAIQPTARAALINQYKQESSTAIKYKIGSFLKADELLSN